ncbi:MAG: hypothetical protein U0984_10160 [Prosthecobacter sp.]|nr:hypothetical protein [Prosthecobacter sp.]
MKRAVVILACLGIGIAVFFLVRQSAPESARQQSPAAPGGQQTTAVTPPPGDGPSPSVSQAELASRGSPLAGQLNAPDAPPDQDVVVLRDLIRQYLSALQRRPGPPIGDDADLVRALSGRNPLKLTVIPGNHPAINAEGRLLDRWGTPYLIHARSSQSYEVRSAGPDKRLFTADDFVAPP